METTKSRMLRSVCMCVTAGALLVTLVFTAPLTVRASTLTVTSCADDGTTGTLRSKIATAIADNTNDTINFNLDCPSGSPIMLNSGSGTLTLSVSMVIDGTGHSIVLDGNNAVTVFTINSGATVTLNALTIQHGDANPGSGIGTGGGIANNGTLTVTNSILSTNLATGNPAGVGGGIFNNTGSMLTVTNSTFSGNSALIGGGIENNGTATVSASTFSGNGGSGAGIDSSGNGHALTVTNSTFSGNATGMGIHMTTVSGGAINGGGNMTLTNSTLSGNTATGSDGGCGCGGATITNTIIAGNSAPGGGPDVGGSVTSGGHNLIGKTDGSSGWVASDRTGTAASPMNPLLASALASNGGPTQTLALLPGSPAIDGGADTVCAQTGTGKVNNLDQRGIVRPQGAHCDIGAFEARFTLTIAGGGTQSTATGQPFAAPLAVTLGGLDAPANKSGAPVTFTAPNTGPSAILGTPNPATTNTSGAASVTATANMTVGGPYMVIASTPGAANMTFNLTNIPNFVAIGPAAGGTGGGGKVTLTGNGGFGTTANTQVLLDGVAIPAANVLTVMGTQIVYVAPAHSAAGVTVTVKVNGTLLTGSAAYTYGVVNPLPAVQTGNGSGNPSALPNRLPPGTAQGNPNPLPAPRP